MADEGAAGPTWHEREVLTCLQRVAKARSQLATLEVEAGAAADREVVERLEALEVEAVPLRKKAGARFGGGAARDRLAEIDGQQRLLLDELGVADLDEARARAGAGADVDPTLLEFARRELAQAEDELAEVLAMEIPDDADDGGADDGAIDLRDESAAS